jgi:uncharacterized protein (DUF2164 family)
MVKTRIFPHQTADPSSVTFGEWWFERNGARSQLPDFLSGWDYAREEVIGTSLSMDGDALFASTGQSSLDDLEVLLLADCAASQRRVVARHSLAGYATVRSATFALVLPAGQLAGSVRLSAHVIVARDLIDKAPRVASDRGARLISSKTRRLVLEGDASRFPTEPVAFSEFGLPDAPWTLHTNFHDLGTSFMGSVRLLVNTEHPVGKMLLDSATADRVSGLAMADVLRLLVATVANQVEEIGAAEFEEGAVGFVIDSMCAFFLNQGLAASIELYQREPIHFDRVLHERVKPFAKVFL